MTDTTSTDHGDFTIHRRDHRHNDHLAYVQIWVERPASCIHCRQPITVGSKPCWWLWLPEQSEREAEEMMYPTTLSDAISGVGAYIGVLVPGATQEWCEEMTRSIGDLVSCDERLPTGRGMWLHVDTIYQFLAGFGNGQDLIEQWETAGAEAQLVAEA